jgi:hypothetical protein
MLPNAKDLEGKPVPKVTFKTRVNDQWKEISTDEIFKGKTVAVFSLPARIPNLLEHAPAALQTSSHPRSKPKAWTRSSASPSTIHSVMSSGQARPGSRKRQGAAYGNAEFHQRHGACWSTIKPRASPAVMALFDARQGRVIQKMFIEPEKGRRPVRSLRRRHHAQGTSTRRR